MTAVTTLRAHLSTIQCPAELRTLPAWVMWRMEYHEGEDKPRKIPYYANGQKRAGQQGGPDDRRNLVTFDAARTAAARRSMDGVGIALMPEWGLCALDFDKCVLPTGELHPEVAEIAGQSYAEWSPSGKGVRVLFKGNLLNRKSFDGEFGFETFSTKGFVTFTGNRLDICEVLGNADTVTEVTPEVIGLFTRRFGRREDRAATGHTDGVLGLTAEELERAFAAMDPDMRHDDWLAAGMATHHETRGEGFDYWNDWSERGTKYPGRDVLRQRWDSFGRYDGPAVTGRTLVKLAAAAGVAIGPAAPASADEFDVVDTAAEEAKAQAAQDAKPSRFTVVSDEEFMARPAPRWIVKGLVPEGDLLVLFGESGAGKSFVALDIFGAVARGVAWRGLKTRQRRVCFIVAEGGGGFRNRLHAYTQHHGTRPGVTVLHAAPNLMEKGEAKDVAKAIEAARGADIVVVDTFAQTTPGANENAGEDVGKALANCRAIGKALGGALVVLVHHTGKDTTKGARGWSGLRAAADAEIEVSRSTTGRQIRTTKQKDGEDDQRFGFALEVVPVGLDEDDEVITSCAVVDAPLAEKAPKEVHRKLGEREQLLFDAIQNEAKTGAVELSADNIVAAAVAEWASKGAKVDKNTAANFRKSLKRMCGSAVDYLFDDETGAVSL